MFTNNYQIYQQQNRLRWLTVLYDLALNRFRYITDLPLFNQRYFEKQLIDSGKAILVYDNDIFNYLSLGCTFNSYNVYQEPVSFTAIGYDYSKNFSIGAWCIDNYSDYCLKDIINQYANDLSNIDTTKFDSYNIADLLRDLSNDSITIYVPNQNCIDTLQYMVDSKITLALKNAS